MTDTTQPDPQVVPAGQGPASLCLKGDDGGINLYERFADGRLVKILDLDEVPAALWDYLAATLPHVTTEDTP